MFFLASQLFALYLKLIVGVSLGWFLGRQLPNSIPTYLGQVLFWFGVPLGIIAFLRWADLSSSIWLAPIFAWIALLLGAALAWLLLRRNNFSSLSKPAKGSFLLASMVGNTGYLGFPVSLAIVGEKYFSWALFYDLLGSTLGAYGLGVILAAYFGNRAPNFWQLIAAVVKNPALWSLFLGLWLRNYPLPNLAEASLKAIGWTVISSALVLIGMRLSQINSWQKLPVASVSLGIKMLLVPFILGFALSKIGITGSPQMALVLQMGMPPAFATLVIAEAYNLDRDLAVTTLALGSIGLFFTLPIWLYLF